MTNRELIDELSAALTAAAAGDVEALSHLENLFSDIKGLIGEPATPAIASIVLRADEFLQAARSGKPHTVDVLAGLRCITSALGSILCDRCDGGEVAAWLEENLSGLALSDETSGASVEPEVQAEESAAEPEDDVPALDTEICVDFIAEAREHVDAVETHLLRLERDPDEGDSMNALFRAFHTIKGVALHLNLEEISTLAHETENLLDIIRLGQCSWNAMTVEAIFQANDTMKRLLENLSRALVAEELPSPDPNLPELLTCIRKLAVLGNVDLQLGRGVGEERDGDEEGDVAESPEIVPGVQTEEVAREPNSSRSKKPRGFARVDAERLERLVEAAGEMMTAVSVMEQSLEGGVRERMELAQKELNKVGRQLQELGMSLRMVRLQPMFRKMSRLVRDLARQFGKQVDMRVSGGETELDRSMVDRLGDPLLHLMRNAVDHGIESSARDREAAGKPACGTIELRAYHQGGYICIEVEDDGKGLSRERILEKARERGYLKEIENPGDDELYQLIFEPGFSTAETVSTFSGRGVGMDVVRRDVEDLRGSIEVATEPGHGTLFTLRLPLTIAIIDGMVVRVGSERYIVPTSSIIRTVRPTPADFSTVFDSFEMIRFQGALIPLCRLSELFDIEDSAGDVTEGLVMVVQEEGRRTGLFIDEILGQEQIVIKRLGREIRNLPGIAGAAVMPDGRVGLIVDVKNVISLFLDRSGDSLQRAG